MVFCSILSNIDEVLSMKFANVFVFWDFNVHDKDWLIYSGGTDRPDELCYYFILNDLTQMVNCPTWIPDCDSRSCFFGFIPILWCYYLFYNDFPSIGKLRSWCCLSFQWLSVKLKTVCPVSSNSLWIFSCWFGRSLWSFERCSMRRYL